MPAHDASEAPAMAPAPEPAPPSGGPSAGSPAAPGGSSEWPERVGSIARYTGQWVARPRVRLAVTGVLLLMIGGVLVTNSVWTLPVVVVGALMVLVAWIGHRLEGRFAIEWGETGTELAFRATIKAAASASASAPAPVSAPVPADARPALATDETRAPAFEPPAGSDHQRIIEGEAHTVEIDVAELRALIAAADHTAREPQPAPAADIRIRRAVDGVRSSQPAP